jgi:hypothetical protein
MRVTIKDLEDWVRPRTVTTLTLILLAALWSVVIASAVSGRQASIASTGELLQRTGRAVEEQTLQQLRLTDVLLATAAHWLQANPGRDPPQRSRLPEIAGGLSRQNRRLDRHPAADRGWQCLRRSGQEPATPGECRRQRVLQGCTGQQGAVHWPPREYPAQWRLRLADRPCVAQPDTWHPGDRRDRRPADTDREIRRPASASREARSPCSETTGWCSPGRRRMHHCPASPSPKGGFSASA